MIQAQQALEQQILWQELEDAADIPEEADLPFLCQMLDQAITLVPEHLRLAVAGEAFVQLANIYASRASSLLDAWERSYNSLGLVLTAEGLADLLVRQSLHLDLGDLLQVPEHKYIRSGESLLASVDPLVGHVDRETLLEVLAQQCEFEVDDETAKAKALDLAHDEDVSVWVRAIAQFFSSRQVQSVRLIELVEGVQYPTLDQGIGQRSPLVQTWLALLLGGFRLEQSTEDFYNTRGIWVRVPQTGMQSNVDILPAP